MRDIRSLEIPIRGARAARALRPSLLLVPLFLLYVLISLVGNQSPGDESRYLLYAHNLTRGFYADTHTTISGAYLWNGPALPALLAPLVAVHAPLGVIRVIAGPALLASAIAIFHRAVRFYLRESTAILASYALGLYPPFFTIIGEVHVEPLATLCLTLAVLFIARAFRRRGRDHLWAGVALGVLALSRVEYGYALASCFVISCVCMIWTRGWSVTGAARRSVLATGVGLLLCVPWLAYTYSLTHKAFYWGNAGGLSLYWMAVPGNLGDWHPDNVFTVPALAPDRRFLTGLESLPPLAQDSRLQSVAITDIKRNPKHYLSNILNNLDRLAFNSPYTATQEKATTLLYVVPNAILLGLLTLSALIALRCRRRIRDEQPEVLPIAVFTVIGFLVHVPVAAYARFTIPLTPALLWLTIAVIAPSVQLRTRSRPTPSALPIEVG